eukprot:m.30176 g.30176  ORF g.30176 m.30176 type:complete len:431 (+) comp9382_c0_seq1:59-1351(+)
MGDVDGHLVAESVVNEGTVSTDRTRWQEWVASNATPPTAPRKVIIDCDPGLDDCEALMLCLGDPSVTVVAITVVSGNVSVHQCARNVQRILRVCGRVDVPVFVGSSRPLLSDRQHAEYYHGRDGLGNADPVGDEVASAETPVLGDEVAAMALVRLCREHLEPTSGTTDLHARAAALEQAAAELEVKLGEFSAKGKFEDARRVQHEVAVLRDQADVCRQTASHAKPAVDIVALGPLTNLALACRLSRTFPATVRSLVCMGGTLDARGNVPNFPTNEFNFHADPEAVEIVFGDMHRLVVVTWEACLSRAVDWAVWEQWLNDAAAASEAGRRKAAFLRRIRAQTQGMTRAFVPCDPLAAAIYLRPDLLVPLGSDPEQTPVFFRHVKMELSGKATRGQLVVDWSNLTHHHPNAFVVRDTDVDAFGRVFVQALSA